MQQWPEMMWWHTAYPDTQGITAVLTIVQTIYGRKLGCILINAISTDFELGTPSTMLQNLHCSKFLPMFKLCSMFMPQFPCFASKICIFMGKWQV